MSATGVRLRMTRKPPVTNGQILLLNMTCGDGELAIKGQVRWWRRAGLRRFEVGLKFVRLTPGSEELLESIARHGYGSRAQRRAAPDQEPGKTNPTVSVAVDLPNYYAVLGLRPDADYPAIRRRYHQLAARVHPDVNPEEGARERFEAIYEAYRVLSDVRRRQAYRSLVK